MPESTLKIGLCIADLQNERSGIGNHIHNIISEISKINKNLTLIRHQTGVNSYSLPEIVPWDPFYEFNIMYWSAMISLQKNLFTDLDIFHSPTLCLFPVKPHKRFILTVHDVIHYLFPEYCTAGTVRYTRLLFNHTLKMSDKIIVDSQATARDLITYYKVKESKIEVVLNAASPDYRPLPSDQVNQVRIRYNLDNPFILFTGTIEPRKNIPLLLRAYSLVLKQIPDIELVIAGGKGWKNSEVYDTLKTLGIEKKVRFLGYVAHEDLPAIYNAASVFVYPSFYEGFGLPPLEAMQCGIPVITSNTSSLPEVVGPGGLMVDPADHEQLARFISHIFTDENFREKNRAYNLNRARLFSWEQTAKKTCDVYQQVFRMKQ